MELIKYIDHFILSTIIIQDLQHLETEATLGLGASALNKGNYLGRRHDIY